MQSFFSELEFPLPLSDYSRGKALHAYKRALADGNIAVITGIERIGAQDDELRQSLEQARGPLDPVSQKAASEGASSLDASARPGRIGFAAPVRDGEVTFNGKVALEGQVAVDGQVALDGKIHLQNPADKDN